MIEVSSSEEDPKEDPEEDLEEIHPEPTVEAPDIPEIDEDPLIDVDSPEDVILVPEAESTEESGPRWLVESNDSSGRDGQSESASAVHVPSPVVRTDSSQSSSEFAALPDKDALGSSDDAGVILHIVV